MCTRGLPDIYTLSPWDCGPRASGVYIRQTTRAHGITTKYILDDVKKSSILKNGIGIEGKKSTQTSKKYICRRIKMVLKCC